MVIKCKECRQRTSRADGTCSTKSCPLYRANRRGVQTKQVWAQRSVRTTPTSSSHLRGLLLCMRPVINQLDIKSHFALRRCGRCTGLAWVGPQPLAREQQIHYWLARFLHVDGPHAIELQRHGMSMGLPNPSAGVCSGLVGCHGPSSAPQPLA